MIKKLFAGILSFSVLCSTYHVELFTKPREQKISGQKVSVQNQGQEDVLEYQNIHCENLSAQMAGDTENTEAEEGILYGDFRYVLREGNPQTAAICRYTGTQASVVVPDLIDGIQVTEIADGAFENCFHLESIILPDGLEYIGENAFRMCRNLGEVRIPDGVENIGRSAFQYCSRLSDVRFPASMTSIGASAFDGCSELGEITIPEGITMIEDSTFYYCQKLIKVNLPDGVARIGERAFNGCFNLVNIMIPRSISEISTTAFAGCRRLTILGFLNTYAQSYAENSEIHFRDLEEDYLIGTVQAADREHRSVTVAGQVYIVSDDFDFAVLDQILSLDDADVICTMKNDKIIDVERVRDAVSLETSLAIASKPPITIENGIYMETCQDVEVIVEINTMYPLSAFDSAEETGIYVDEISCETADEGLFLTDGRNNKTGNKKFVQVIKQKMKPGDFFNDFWVAYADKGYWISEQIMPYTVTLHVETEYGPISKGLDLHAYNHDLGGDQGTLLANARRELQNLFQKQLLDVDLESCLDSSRLGILERYLYTWMAQIDYAYSFSGDARLRRSMLARLGVDPDADLSSGNIKAVTNVKLKTQYGEKTIAAALDIGKPTGQGGLAASFGELEYRMLEKDGIPEGVTLEGKCKAVPYEHFKPFAESVRQQVDETLGSVYQLNRRKDDIAACFAIDQTIVNIVGIELGFYFDQMYVANSYSTTNYTKTVTVDGPVNISMYDFSGNLCCRIANNVIEENPADIRIHVSGDTKTFNLSANSYYIELEGTGNGTMTYQIVESTIDSFMSRTMLFTDLVLEDHKLYTGYLLKEARVDSRAYSLDASGQVSYPDQDTLQTAFQKMERLTLSQSETSLEAEHTLKLEADVLPEHASNKNLYWISDHPSVAEVDRNGLVTAVGPGTAVITAMSMDGSFLKASCAIKVQKTISDQEPGGDQPVPPDDTGSSGDSGSNGGNFGSTGSGGTSGAGSAGNSSGSGTNGNDASDDQLEVTFMYYIISFEANGGTNLSRRTMTLLKDDNLGILPKVYRENYIFDGWYTQENGGEKVDSLFVSNAGTSLYAQWTAAKPEKVTISNLESSKSGEFLVNFKGIRASGYELSYSLKKKFPAAATKKVAIAAEKKTVTGLKSGRRYYVRVRAYQFDSVGRKVYGAYSAVKSVKVK